MKTCKKGLHQYDAKYKACPKCKLARDGLKKKEHPPSKAKRQQYSLKSDYGLTIDQFTDMLNKQNNCCAICRKPETAINYRDGKVRNLSVDHCHKTGKVRKLLCSNCNRVLGFVKENISTLESFILYLKEYEREID